VEAADGAWQPLGELLVSKNLVSREELDLALEEQAQTGRLLGAILVDRGCVSGPALAVALAEQCGVELHQQRGFGTGLWAEIERRHRSGRDAEVVQLEPGPARALEAVPDLGPDPALERLEEENRRLLGEIDRLRNEYTRLKVLETPELPSSHLLFVPTPRRYLLVERDGPPPEPGDAVMLDEGAFVVGKVGRAPVPGDRRACAFLLSAGTRLHE
jgi:hypothetical protein